MCLQVLLGRVAPERSFPALKKEMAAVLGPPDARCEANGLIPLVLLGLVLQLVAGVFYVCARTLHGVATRQDDGRSKRQCQKKS